MTLHSINTGFFKLDGGAMFGVVPKSIWNKINTADENNMCSWALRCLLIEEGDRLILVDTGMGDKQDAKFFSHYYMHGNDTLDKSLAKLGFKREDITDVLLTHLHFDHCGGCIVRDGDKLIPAFKNADFWINRDHWEWAINPNAREKASFLKENILPIHESGRLHFIESPKDMSLASGIPSAIFDNTSIKLRFANGHTKNMMLPQLDYKGRTIIYMADLLPSQGHIPLPYVMAYDMFPQITLEEKKSFLSEAVTNNYILFFEHDAQNECCELEMTEKAVKVRRSFKLEDI